jgi:F420 biosynthesis protein FbiB-like protein
MTGTKLTPTSSFDELFATMRARSSVRAFLPDPVPSELIRRAIEAAGWAPSPHGTQPWRFVVIESQTVRQRLSDAMAQTWRDQLTMDGDDPVIIERRLRKSQERLEIPPVVVVLCLYLENAAQYPDPDRQDAEELMAIQSLGAAAQNFLLALEAQGLQAGWMCAPLFVPGLVAETLGLAPGLIPHAMFPIGRMAAAPKRRSRLPVDDLIAAWFAKGE